MEARTGDIAMQSESRSVQEETTVASVGSDAQDIRESSGETDTRSTSLQPGEADSSVTAASEKEAFDLFGFPVAAASDLSGFAYGQLADSVKSVYAQLYTGVSAEKEVFSLRAADAEEVKTALSALIVDHPEFFWLSGNAGISGFRAFGVWQIQLEYDTEPGSIPQIRQMIETSVQEYLASLPVEAGEYEKVRKAYEYIIGTTDYAAEAPHNQNIQSVFVNHLSVCAGYARAMQYLLQRAGVFCTYVEGTSGDGTETHAWDLVRIDGIYTYVDPSWGDPTYGEDAADAASLPIIYDYLCLTSEEMRRTKHVPADDLQLPECTDTSFDYYRLNGMYYETYSRDELSAAVWHAVDEGEDEVFMKFADEESYAAARAALFPDDPDTESLLAAPIRQRMEWDAASSMNYYYSCSDELRIIKIYW